MYKLYKLPEGFIVASEEEIKPGELMYDEEGDGGLPNIRMNSDSFTYNAPGYFKIISQQDQIDFSALSEEEQKEIGWFDAEQLAKAFFESERERINSDFNKNASKEQKESLYSHYDRTFTPLFVAGFQKALELTSDRRFTEVDMKACWQQAISSYVGKGRTIFFEQFIQSLSQPKSWDIECVEGDGKIKILRIL